MSHLRIVRTAQGFSILHAVDGLPVTGPLPSGLVGVLVFDTESEAEAYTRAPEGRFVARFARSGPSLAGSWLSDSWTVRFPTERDRDEWLAAHRALDLAVDRGFIISTV